MGISLLEALKRNTDTNVLSIFSSNSSIFQIARQILALVVNHRYSDGRILCQKVIVRLSEVCNQDTERRRKENSTVVIPVN